MNENWKSTTFFGKKVSSIFLLVQSMTETVLVDWARLTFEGKEKHIAERQQVGYSAETWRQAGQIVVIDVDIWRLCLGNEIRSGFGRLPFWVCRNFEKENQKLETLQIQIRFNLKPKEALVRSNWNRLIRSEMMGKRFHKMTYYIQCTTWIDIYEYKTASILDKC